MSSPTNATSPRPRKLIPPGRSRRGSSLNQPPPNLSALSIPTLPFVNNDVFELNSATIEKLKTLNRSSSDSAVLEIYDSEPTAEAVSTLRSLITTKEDELKLSAEIGQELLWKFQSVVTAYQTLATHYTELELKYKETVDEKEILVAEKAGLLKKLNDVRSHLSSTESSLIDIRESTSTKITQATAILQDTQNRETELLRTVSDLEEKANKAMKEEAKSKKDLKKWKEKCGKLQTRIDRFQQRDTDLQEKVKSVQEINRKLRDEVAKLTHQANLSFPSPTPSQPDELTQLVTIIQELQSSNFKIKSEYSQLEELLTEYRNEIASLQAQMEEKETLMIRDDLRSVHDLLGKKVDGGAAFGVETNWDGARHDAVSSIDQSPTRAVDNTGHVSPRSPRSRESPTKELGDTSSVMSSSFGNSLYQQTLNEELSMHSYSNVDEESVSDPRSPSKQLFDINSKPHTDLLNFDVILTILTNLHTHALSLLKRLSATDTVTLNRRLKRAFDIDDLTKMSNELIENVRIDVGWLGEKVGVSIAGIADLDSDRAGSKPTSETQSPSSIDKNNDNPFNPSSSSTLETTYQSKFNTSIHALTSLVQELLLSIASLRTSLNLYASVYVQKMEDKSRQQEQQIHERRMSNQSTSSSSSVQHLPGTARSRSRSMSPELPEDQNHKENIKENSRLSISSSIASYTSWASTILLGNSPGKPGQQPPWRHRKSAPSSVRRVFTYSGSKSMGPSSPVSKAATNSRENDSQDGSDSSSKPTIRKSQSKKRAVSYHFSSSTTPSSSSPSQSSTMADPNINHSLTDGINKPIESFVRDVNGVVVGWERSRHGTNDDNFESDNDQQADREIGTVNNEESVRAGKN